MISTGTNYQSCTEKKKHNVILKFGWLTTSINEIWTPHILENITCDKQILTHRHIVFFSHNRGMVTDHKVVMVTSSEVAGSHGNNGNGNLFFVFI